MDATMINAGGIIGSGIFMVPATVALYTMSTSLFFSIWIIGAIISLFGALSVAELGAAMPKSGGQYVYLNEAYGPVWGYLYGWTTVAVINAASMAAVGVAGAEYLRFFFPISDLGVRGIAIISIILLTVLNIYDVKSSARFQNGLTIAKISAIVIIIFFGFYLDGGATQNFTPLFSDQPVLSLIGPLGLAMVAVLWTFDGWIYITYVAGEVKNPKQNIPLSLIFCMIIVVSVYLAINTVLVYVLGFDQMIGSDSVISDASTVFLGNNGASIVTLIIVVSLLGGNNVNVLTNARIIYAMAKEDRFFKVADQVHPKYKTPSNAIFIQCIWAIILTFTGSFNQLITYIIFVSWIFYGMSAGAVIILRNKKPDLERPYKTPFYPWIPTIFILFAVFLTINTIMEAPRDAAIGTVIMLAGLPLYYYWKNRD
jgi:APA family basic amino acid/polyamine antiporter